MSQSSIKAFTSFLGNTFVLYVKTLNFHWNMEGAEFFMYHKLLEAQYEELAEAIDEIAERIRQLGAKAPGSMAHLLKVASLKEAPEALPQEKMIHLLVEDHFKLKEEGLDLIDLFLEEGDQGTADLLIQRIKSHDKARWLLESHFPSSSRNH